MNFVDIFKTEILDHISRLKSILGTDVPGMQSGHEITDDTDEVLKKIDSVKNVIIKDHDEIQNFLLFARARCSRPSWTQRPTTW